MPEKPKRKWIKAGPDPLRYEYGRDNPDAGGAPIIDALAYVEREPSGYFKWGLYRGERNEQAAPSLKEAQAAAVSALEEAGVLS